MDNITNSIKHNNKGQLGVPCIACGNIVPLTDDEEMLYRRGYGLPSKMCDGCKKGQFEVKKRNSNPILTIISFVMLVLLVVGTIAYVIMYGVLSWTNPDMTHIRLLLEHPYLIYIGIGLAVFGLIEGLLIKLN